MSTQVQETTQAASVSESSATPAATEAGSAAPATKEAAPASAGSPNASPTEAPAAPIWAPNFKFRAGKEDKEIDEFLRPVITSPEIEKKIVEMYQRSHGLDFVKKERDSFKQDFYKSRDELTPIKRELEQVGSYFKEGQFDKAFKLMGLEKEQLYNWFRGELEYQQLPPDQKARVDALNREKEARLSARSEADTLKAQFAEERVQTLQTQIDQVMAHPRVVSAAKQFDQRFGKEGAFFDELTLRGDILFNKTGKLTPPDVIAVDLMKMAGLWENQQQADAGTPQPSNPDRPVVTAPPADKPTIKSFQAKSATPVRKSPRSLEDLRNLQREMSGKGIEAGRR